MAVTDSGLVRAFKPEAYGQLVDAVLADESVAFNPHVASVVRITNEQVRLPIITGDPDVAWVPENTEITPEDPSLGEIVVAPKAVKGLTQLSNEAVMDTSPAAVTLTGQTLARSVGKKIDAALFSLSALTNGPQKPLGVAAYTAVDTEGVISGVADLDLFYTAKKVAEDHNATLSAFVISPAVALQLSLVKVLTSGSNQPLLPDVSTVAGLPVIVSRAVDADTLFWGVDAAQIFSVQRLGTTVATSSDAAFSADATQVRVVARWDVGLANEAGIIRAYDVSPA